MNDSAETLEIKTMVYVLTGFLILLDLPGLIWLLSPSPDGSREAIKILVVVGVGGVVNFLVAIIARYRLGLIRNDWSRLDRRVGQFLFFCMFWMVITYLISYLTQLVIPL